MLKFLLKSKDILHQVSNDLGEVNGFYDSFSNAGQKSPPILPANDGAITFKINHQLPSPFNSTTAKMGKKRGREKYKNLNISMKNRAFFVK